MTSEAKYRENQIAVLIDLENIGLDCIQWLFDQIADAGRITVRRAYADWSLEKKKRDQLLELGIEAVPMVRTTSGGKNASDIRLAIDAIDLLYTSQVDIFVIVSSDTDYVPLAAKLRAAGKIVFGAGEEAKAPRTLVKSCDRYFYLEEQSCRTDDASGGNKKQAQEIQDILVRAIGACADEHGQVKGSRLHDTIVKMDPGFSYKILGHSTFRKFLEASPLLKVTKPKGPGDVTIELKNQGKEALPEPDLTATIWQDIDTSWQGRMGKYGENIPGSVAAGDAARLMKIPKISGTKFKTLQGVLEASPYLSGRWLREGNLIRHK